MLKINLNKLYYFYVVAKEGSIKAASQLLNLTQPTISGQIKQLEEDLGVDLFIRKHRKLVLSSAGTETLKQAEQIFELADQLADTTRLKQGKVRSRVRIGAVQSLSNSFINDFSTKIWSDESVLIEIRQGQYSTLIDDLNHNKLDILLCDGPMYESKKYQCVPLGHDQAVAVCSPKMQTTKATFPLNLQGMRFVANSNDSFLQKEVNHYFERNSVTPEVIAKVDDVTLMRIICETGSCFATMPKRAVKESLKNKKLKLLGELKGVESALWAITPRVSSNRRLVNKLIRDYLKFKSK